MRRIVATFALLCASGFCAGQNVGVKASQFKKICEAERAANIDLSGVQTLLGQFRDQTGAPFPAGYAVEMRSPISGSVLRSAPLDQNGHFTLDRLKYDRVNVILVLMVQGQARRTGFETPTHLECDKSGVCKLEIVLKAGSTDDIKDQCPLD